MTQVNNSLFGVLSRAPRDHSASTPGSGTPRNIVEYLDRRFPPKFTSSTSAGSFDSRVELVLDYFLVCKSMSLWTILGSEANVTELKDTINKMEDYRGSGVNPYHRPGDTVVEGSNNLFQTLTRRAEGGSLF